MLNLPFVVQPKQKPTEIQIGTEASGVIAINRLGYLTVAEKAAFQQVKPANTGGPLLHTLAKKIADDTGKPLETVLNSLSALSGGKVSKTQEKLLEPYTAEIMEIMAAFGADVEQATLVKATVLLITRIDPEWTFEQSIELHPDLLYGLAELFDAEEARSIEQLASQYTKDESETEAGDDQGKEQAQT